MPRAVYPLLFAMCVTALFDASAWGEPTSDPLQAQGVITAPDWVHKPSGEEFADAYPVIAEALSIPGRVELNCAVTAGGDVEGCRAVAETPHFLGFAEAAISLGPKFKMRPLTIDGAPVGGARVNIPIRFSLGGEILPEPPPAPEVIAQPTAEAVALARRIVVASGAQGALPTETANFVRAINKAARQTTAFGRAGRAQMAALEAVKASLEAAQPQFADARAQALARTFDEERLRSIAEFLESPAGRAWVDDAGAVDALEAKEAIALFQAAAQAGRAAACEGSCPTAIAPATP
jgi:TonB family protein